MTGRVIRGCGPKHLKARNGKGWRTDEATGFTRYAEDFVFDTRQGKTAKEFADITPGFGTYHPQDVKNLQVLDDPRALHDARPEQKPLTFMNEQQFSDQEVKLSIQEGRAPRHGF